MEFSIIFPPKSDVSLSMCVSYHHHRHYHHHIACSVLGLVACSVPTDSREVLGEIVVGFVSHMADIS